jgi:hypothetical protein
MEQKLEGFIWLQMQVCLAYSLDTLDVHMQVPIERHVILNHVTASISIHNCTKHNMLAKIRLKSARKNDPRESSSL